MGFTEVNSLDADVTLRLGGVDKKTGKKNPVQAEGYYLGAKEINSPKSKSGKASLHILSTENGNIGVWGKTNMDQKLKSVVPGTMIRITFTNMQPTPNGDMYVYKVETDKDNVMDVGNLTASAGAPANDTSSDFSDNSAETEDAPEEEDEDVAALAAARKAKMQALLNRKTK